MAIKTFKPTTPSRRHMTVSAFEGIDKKAKPERSLVESQKKHAGRNSYGRITVSSPATACPSPTSLLVPSSTTLRCTPARALSSSAPPVLLLS